MNSTVLITLQSEKCYVSFSSVKGACIAISDGCDVKQGSNEMSKVCQTKGLYPFVMEKDVYLITQTKDYNKCFGVPFDWRPYIKDFLEIMKKFEGTSKMTYKESWKFPSLPWSYTDGLVF